MRDFLEQGELPMKHKNLIFCMLLLLYSALCSAEESRPGTISGKWITKEHGPMTNGQVLLFNADKGPAPASNRFLRLPDAGVKIDSAGAFSTNLPPGQYYLVMRKRSNPNSAGPPEEGDLQFYARLKNGDPKIFTLKSGKTTNIGTIMVAAPFRKEKNVAKDGMSGIEGTITDEQGKPVEGARVFIYESARMLGMPRYASDKTGEDGKYSLSLSSQGTYFLKARTHYGGGKPAVGELMGSLEKSDGSGALVVEKGKISRGVDITVKSFSTGRPPGR